jgi:hypothetical protein
LLRAYGINGQPGADDYAAACDALEAFVDEAVELVESEGYSAEANLRNLLAARAALVVLRAGVRPPFCPEDAKSPSETPSPEAGLHVGRGKLPTPRRDGAEQDEAGQEGVGRC